MNQIGWCVLFAVLAVPLAIVVTFMLSPFWDWFESVSQIESLGHSGPAEWCYIVIYLIHLAFIVTAGVIRYRKHKSKTPPGHC